MLTLTLSDGRGNMIQVHLDLDKYKPDKNGDYLVTETDKIEVVIAVADALKNKNKHNLTTGE